MFARTSPVDRIRDMDTRLLVSGERLRRYRDQDREVSVLVLRAVIDRQLDERLAFMLERDRAALSSARA